MSVMIQIRNVPAELHRKLKARAALQGLSLSDYLLREVQRLAERPTLEEVRARIEQRTPVRLRIGSVRAIRSERDKR